jgi:hypothetical protein
MSKPERHQQPWTAIEDGFLRCPITSSKLAMGALRGRLVSSIRWRRRYLGISIGNWYLRDENRKRKKRYELTDFPGVDWSKTLRELMDETGLAIKAVWRLRKEYGERIKVAKPIRAGRRGFRADDFPGVDWSRSARSIAGELGMSWRVVSRMKKEKISNIGNPYLQHRKRRITNIGKSG